MAYVDAAQLRAYLEKYIATYLETVRGKQGTKEPPFAKGAPHRVRALILPNEGVVVLTTYGAPAQEVTVQRVTLEEARKAVHEAPLSHFMSFYPTTPFEAADAAADAQTDVAREVRVSTYRAGLTAARMHIGEAAKQLRDAGKASPWLQAQFEEFAGRLEKSNDPLKQLAEAEEKAERVDEPAAHEAKVARLGGLPTGDPPVVDEQLVNSYITTYLTTYHAGLRTDIPTPALPLFARGKPYRIRGIILPNEAVSVLVKYHAGNDQITTGREGWEKFEASVKAREHDLMATYPPLRVLTSSEAANDATANVVRDTRNGIHRALLSSTKAIASDIQEKVTDIVKTNPWLEQPLAGVTKRMQGVGQLLEVLGQTLERNEKGLNAAEEMTRLDNLRRFKTPIRGFEEVFTPIDGPGAPRPAARESHSPLEELLAGSGLLMDTPKAPAPPTAAVPAAPSRPAPGPAPAPAPAMRPAPGPAPAAAPGAPAPQRPAAAPGPAPAPSTRPPVGPGAAPAPPTASAAPVQQRTVAGMGLAEADQKMLEALRGEMYNLRRKVDDFDQRLRYLDNLNGKLLADTNGKLKLQTEIVKAEVSSGNKATWALGFTAMILALIAIVGNYSQIVASILTLIGR